MYQRRLKYIRENNKIHQYTISKVLNISPKTYSVYEIESDIFPIKHLNTIANYFDVSLDYLFNFTKIKKYTNTKNALNPAISGERLKKLRTERNLTQEELGSILNVDQSTIAKYEKGLNIIATQFLYAICKKYKISADYLLGKID